MSSSPAQPLDAIRRAWRSAFGSRKVAYLSGPITTGPRFIDWWGETGHALAPGSDEFAAGLRQYVILPNERDLQATAEILRGRNTEAVIEPASVFVTDWSQQDYLILWEEFITDHASRILLMDGWQFSAGCATEFCRAHLEGVPTALIDGSPVVARDGIDAIAQAIASVEQLPERPEALLRALAGAHEKLRENLRVQNCRYREVWPTVDDAMADRQYPRAAILRSQPASKTVNRVPSVTNGNILVCQVVAGSVFHG